MKKNIIVLWMIVFFCITVEAAAQTSRIHLDETIVRMQRLLDNSQPDCKKVRAIRKILSREVSDKECTAPNTRSNLSLLTVCSLKTRATIACPLKVPRIPPPSPGGEPNPETVINDCDAKIKRAISKSKKEFIEQNTENKDLMRTQALEAQENFYDPLKASINDKTNRCTANECPNYEAARDELNKWAVFIIQRLPTDSDDSIQFAKEVIAGLDISTKKLLKAVEGRNWNNEEMVNFVKILKAKGLAVESFIHLMPALEKHDEALTLIEKISNFCIENQCSWTQIHSAFEMSQYLNDNQRREVLRKILIKLKDRYPQLREEAIKVEAELKEKFSDIFVVSRFFAVIDPLVLDEYKKEVETARGIYHSPDSAKYIPVIILESEAIDSIENCDPVDELWTKLVELLHLKFGSKSGLQIPSVTTYDTSGKRDEYLAQISDIIEGVLTNKPINELERCSNNKNPVFSAICSAPIPGAVVITVDKTSSGIAAVETRFWQTGAGGKIPYRVQIIKNELPTICDKDHRLDREEVGLRLAEEIVSKSPIFKAASIVDDFSPLPAIARPKALSALLSPGLPFLMDDSSENNTVGWIYSGMEVALLLCTGTFTMLRNDARNRYDDGEAGAFEQSQVFSGMVYGCLAATVVTRLVAVVHYRKYSRGKRKGVFND
jgi:hypothetical protein